MPKYLEFVTIDLWTLIFTWANMLILFMLVKKYLFKPVQSILDARKNEIEKIYSDAASANERAVAMEKDYSSKIALAKDEAGNIIKTATLTAQKREEEILNEAKEKAVHMTQRAQSEIEQEKKKAYQEIKSEIAEISISIAEKMVGREINTKDHDALISQFIENVGEAR